MGAVVSKYCWGTQKEMQTVPLSSWLIGPGMEQTAYSGVRFNPQAAFCIQIRD